MTSIRDSCLKDAVSVVPMEIIRFLILYIETKLAKQQNTSVLLYSLLHSRSLKACRGMLSRDISLSEPPGDPIKVSDIFDTFDLKSCFLFHIFSIFYCNIHCRPGSAVGLPKPRPSVPPPGKPVMWACTQWGPQGSSKPDQVFERIISKL